MPPRFRFSRPVLLGLASLVGFGCAETSEPEPALGKIDQAYLVWDYGLAQSSSLLHQAPVGAGGVRVCLDGTGFTASNRASYESAAKDAIMAWVNAARPISKVPFITAGDIAISCSSPHVTISWQAGTTGSATGQPGLVTLHGQGPSVLLHEFGHVFGLLDTYVGSVTTCADGQAHSVMCDGDFQKAPTADDIDAIQRAYCALYPAQCKAHWDTSTAWCTGAGKELRVGDFNGDQRADVVCHDSSTGTQTFSWATTSATFTGTSWTYAIGWCKAPNTLVAGDFNGDGRSDLLCHDPVAGSDSVAITNQWGYFTSPTYFTLPYCSGSGRTFNGVGDFNGDGRSDLLCRWSDGTIITYNANTSGTFNGVSWAGTWTALCGASGRLLQGDVNRDGRDDLVCSDPTSNALRVAYASSTGTFSTIGFQATINFCAQSGAILQMADIDGDGRDDLYCREIHSYNYGGHWVALAQSDGTFKGSSRYWVTYYDAASTKTYLGDVDANGGADVIFLNAAGSLAVDYQKTQSTLVASGEFHSCALTPDGLAKCWGDNTSRQLAVPYLGRYTSLTLGGDFSCGIRAKDSGVTCWGGPTASTTPAGAFTSISAGNFHVCGIKPDGSIGCWIGSNASNWNQAPANVSGVFTKVAAGGAHTCALRNGNAECWGLNDKGQAPAFRAGPFDAITAGWGFTCARRTDQTIACWGDNTYGQAPVSVSGSFADVTAGSQHACAQRNDGTVLCWGRNDAGQTSVPSDVFVSGQVRAHGKHACGVLRSDNSLKCWGNNSYGESSPAL